MGKYKTYTEDPGNRLNVVSGVLSGVSGGPPSTHIGNAVGDFADRAFEVLADPPTRPNHGIVRFQAHARGFLDSVLVAQLAGSATDFTVVVLDKFQDGNSPPNYVWINSTTVTLPGEYGVEKPIPYGQPGYGYNYTDYISGSFKTIFSYGIMSSYENRATYAHDASELYLMVIPNAGVDNVFRVRLATVALS
jgi:hypothetical protein